MNKINGFTATDGNGVQSDAASGQPAGHDITAQGWGPGKVAELMQALAPTPRGRPDEALLRQQLSLAFLAGASAGQEESLPLALKAIEQARALLKNRAASQADRLSHAFEAGQRAASGGTRAGAASASVSPRARHADSGRSAKSPLKLFVRQPFTESGQSQQLLVSQVLDRIDRCNGKPRVFDYLTGRKAESAETFRSSFEAETGQPFTPHAFRAHRLGMLSQADAFVNIRVSMSESSAFELAYHVFSGTCAPVLFLVWKQASIKTTLLKELDNICDVTYLEFEHPDELQGGMADFFHRCAARDAVAA